MAKMVNKCFRNVPDTVQAALAAEVRETGSSKNDVAVGILADHYNVSFEPTGAKSRLRGTVNGQSRMNRQTLMLRMPLLLSDTIKRDADFKQRRPQSDVVASILAEHYGLVAAAA